jgi:tetratricopeptide (TPR) repeat protein
MDILLSLQVLQQCSLIRVIGERYQTHPIIRSFCNHHNFVSRKHRDLLINFYIKLASCPYDAQPGRHAEMVVEVNNTKSILFHLLQSNYKDDAKLVNAILEFRKFHSNIGDHSDKLMSQAVQFLQKKDNAIPLLIRCLHSWGKLLYCSSNFISARNKFQEAEKLCSASLENNSSFHADIFCELGQLHILLDALKDAEALYQKALAIHKIANDIIGQGSDYCGLGQIYYRLGKLHEAESLFSKALELHTNANDVLWQGNDNNQLGKIYLRQCEPDKAKTSYFQALDLHKIANDNLGQGHDYNGLGDAYLMLHKPNEAETSFYKALDFHKLANSVLDQGHDYYGLGKVYLSLGRLEKAESSFYKALDLHKVTNSVLGQGNDLLELGKLYVKMSKLKDAKRMFEEALIMHKQAQAPVGQENDEYYLNKVLPKLELSS